MEFPGPGITANDNTYIDIEIDDKGAIYVSTESGHGLYADFYKFNGNNWIDLNNPVQFASSFQRIKITKPVGGKIFVLCDYQNSSGYLRRSIFETLDYGDNWTKIRTFGPVGFKNEIEYSSASNVLYCGYINLYLVDIDESSGNYYHGDDDDFHDDIRDFFIIGIDTLGNEKVLFANDGGLSYMKVDTSDLDSIDFEDINGNHLPIGNFMGLGVTYQEDEFIVSGAVHNASFKYSDSSWSLFGWKADGGDCEVNWLSNEYLYQMNANMLSSNGGSIYSYGKDWFIGMQYALQADDPYNVFFGRKRESSSSVVHLFKYDQRTDIRTDIPVEPNMMQVGPISIINDSLYYCAEFSSAHFPYVPHKFLKTTNGGTDWEDLTFKDVYHRENGAWVVYGTVDNVLHWKTITDIVYNPENPDEMWISISGVWTDGWPNDPVPEKFRVLRTSDGGDTWYDYSEGLPAFPAECLEYQPGTNNRLFVGTDVGVFYRDANMSQWECFSENLPVCFVTDLDYEPCNNYLYASTYGRGIYKTLVPFDDYQQADTIEAGQYVVWDRSKIIFNDVIIPDSTTLYISANMFILEDVKIIVMPGGNLIVEDCLLTNRCYGAWGGIEVWGNPDTTQMYAGLQGKLELYDAEIEHASIGALAGKRNENGGYDSGYEGGIIQAKNTLFHNNGRSVAFLPYQNIHPVTLNEVNNMSRFSLCDFEVNDLLPDYSTFEWFAYLAGVNGVKFKGCIFHNSMTKGPPASPDPGIGIYSVASRFLVDEDCIDPTINPCVDIQPSVFEGLGCGIRAYGIYPQNTCKVENSEFVDNKTGIYLSAMDYAAINLNYFENQYIFQDTLHQFHCGLYLDHCTGYQVEENEFKSFYQVGSPVSSVGITVNNSGGEDNKIYNNYCHNLFAGILAQKENRGNKGLTGLEIKCNDFATCEYDIAVTTDTLFTSDHGIRYNQGSNANLETAPANNVFSYTHNNAESDYYNECNTIVYWHLADTVTANVKPKQYTPRPMIDPTANEFVTSSFNKNDNCPSTFSSGGGGEIEGKRSSMAEAETKIDSTKNLLELLVDGGDTEALHTEVETSFPDEALEIRNELISVSPYLSDSVMVSTVGQENVLTEAMVTEILMANPQSAKSDTVQEVLDNRFNQLSEEQRTDIDQGWFVVGAKESLESSLAAYLAQKQEALNGIIRIYRNDSIYTSANDSIIASFMNEYSISAKYELAFEYFIKGDDNSATSTLGDIPLTYDLSATESNQHQQYVNYLNLLIQLRNQNRSILDCDQTQILVLDTILNNSYGRLQMTARNILINTGVYNYIEPYILPEEGLKENRIRRIPVRKYYTVDRFKLYPNPAGNYLIIEYILQSEIPQGVVNLLDNRGTVVKSFSLTKCHDYIVVETSDLPSGIYYCNFVVDAESVQTEKLIIAH